ncbi:MAG: citrate synthase [Planctomycetaceae bacterium]|nr:MAG: citrate synthase [Planctomycetaceae bacterium]
MPLEAYHPGLEGVIAGETAVSSITGGLSYRGYSITDLALQSTFPEVAYLLLYSELPTEEQLADFKAILDESAGVEPALLQFLGQVPLHVSAMDALRTGVSAVAHFDPQHDDESPAARIAQATRLLAQIPVLIAARYRLRRGLPLVPHDSGLSFAGNLLQMITGTAPSALAEKAFDVSLILYAEHEFNASTFTARVITSTQSDLYSAVVGAIGALKGALHGGANERVLEVLEEVREPALAEGWVRQALARKRRIMGFGHRVYKDGDPRATILRTYCQLLANETKDSRLEQIADTIESIVRTEKGLPPNLDWPSARLYHYLGLEVDLFTPLFVASRVTGWAAHVIEQTASNRLIRPRSRYVGPAARAYVRLEDRGA